MEDKLTIQEQIEEYLSSLAKKNNHYYRFFSKNTEQDVKEQGQSEKRN